MKSFLGVPIVSHGQVFGNLYLTEKLGAPEFDAEDQAIAVLLAAHAAVAIENARLNDEAQRLLGQVQDVINCFPGVSEAKVELVWEPPWDPRTMASDEAKDILKIW